MNGAASPGRNLWPLLSLWLGVFGFALALTAPLPFVPILSAFTWPLGLAAIMTGWLGRRAADDGLDVRAAGQVRWGIRLGCLGWMVQAVTSVVKMLILAGIVAYVISAFVHNHFTLQPTVTP